MDFLKRLYTRLAPWYDEKKMYAKETAANDSVHEVKLLARDASRVIESYRRYGELAVKRREIRR